MLKYFIKRLIVIIPKLLIITIIIFIGLNLIPGDALSRSMDTTQYEKLTEEQREVMRDNMGLNDPYIVRYFRWIKNIVKGDLGYSSITGASVNSMLAIRLPATLELSLIGLAFATIFGILFGFIAAIRRNKPIDYTMTSIGMMGVSVPDFFFGMMLILLFAVKLGWLPTGGRSSIGAEGFFDEAKYLILPGLCMGINLTANLMRFTRNAMIDVMNKDYMKTARAKGLTEYQVNIKHCFRNGSAPVLMLLTSRLAYLVSGAVVIETVFNYPGMGSLMVSAVTKTDFQVAMSIMLIISIVVLVAYFLADIFLAIMDPRIRFDKEQEG